MNGWSSFSIKEAARRLDLACGGNCLEQDGKFITAQARNRVGETRRLHEPLRVTACSRRSPASWPKRVIHVLEVVEVNEHHRQLLASSIGERQGVLHTVAGTVPRFASIVRSREMPAAAIALPVPCAR